MTTPCTGVGSQCTPAPAPALTPAPSPTLSQASPAGTLFAPSSTVQYGLLILIIVCVVGILVGPVIICALRRYRRIAPAELERIRQEAIERAKNGNIKLPYQTVKGIIVEQPNSSFHLAIYGDPIDYSMREKTHKPEEGSHSEEGREVSPSSDPSTGDLAAAEEGGPIRKGQCRGSVDLEATQEGARLEGQDLVDVEAARQAKNEDLILEMHKI